MESTNIDIEEVVVEIADVLSLHLKRVVDKIINKNDDIAENMKILNQLPIVKELKTTIEKLEKENNELQKKYKSLLEEHLYLKNPVIDNITMEISELKDTSLDIPTMEEITDTFPEPKNLFSIISNFDTTPFTKEDEQKAVTNYKKYGFIGNDAMDSTCLSYTDILTLVQNSTEGVEGWLAFNIDEDEFLITSDDEQKDCEYEDEDDDDEDDDEGCMYFGTNVNLKKNENIHPLLKLQETQDIIDDGSESENESKGPAELAREKEDVEDDVEEDDVEDVVDAVEDVEEEEDAEEEEDVEDVVEEEDVEDVVEEEDVEDVVDDVEDVVDDVEDVEEEVEEDAEEEEDVEDVEEDVEDVEEDVEDVEDDVEYVEEEEEEEDDVEDVVEEDDVEEEEEEDVEEEEEEEEDVEEEEEEEEEEDEIELEEFDFEGKTYYVEDDKNGNLYECLDGGEIGDIIGNLENGAVFFS